MALPLPPFNPSDPIPNNPFYAPEVFTVGGGANPLVVGEGLAVDPLTNSLYVTSAGSGTVTLVNTGPGLTGGPITTTGTISLNPTGILANQYKFPILTVDAYGRITNITDGTPATTTALGVVQLATTSEVVAGTNLIKVVTPAALQGKVSDSVSINSSLCIASSTAVKIAFDCANAAVPLSCYTAGGDILIGTAAGSAVALPLGGQDQVLKANPSGAAPYVYWANDDGGPDIPCAIFTGAGQLITSNNLNVPVSLPAGSADQILALSLDQVTGCILPQWKNNPALCTSLITECGALVTGTALNTPTTLARGADGAHLTVDATSPSGLAWKAACAIPCSCINACGTLITGTGANTVTALPRGDENAVLTVNAACPNGIAWIVPQTPILASVLQATNDIIVASGAGVAGRLPIGAANQVLKVNGDATAIIWANDAVGNDIPCSIIVACGDLIVGQANLTPVRVAKGNEGDILTVCAGSTGGLAWGPNNGVQKSEFTAAGDILIGTGASTLTALAVGTPGYQLTAGAAGAVAWCENTSVDKSLYAAAGDILYASGGATPVPVALNIGTQGYQLKVGAANAPTWCPDLSVQQADYTAQGDILVGTATTPTALNLGGPGTILTACAACAPHGVYWAVDTAIKSSAFSASGDLLVGASTPGTFTTLPISGGAAGNYLKINATATGIEWGPLVTSDDIPKAVLTAKNDIIVASAPASPTVLGTSGVTSNSVLFYDSTAQTISWSANYIPKTSLTLKGQLIVGTGAASPAEPYTALSAGADGLSLTADAADPAGLIWVKHLRSDLFQNKGDILLGAGGACATSVLPVGTTSTQVLVPDAAAAGGVVWCEVASIIPSATPIVQGTVYGHTPSTGTSAALGYQALQALTTGTENTAVGNLALGAVSVGVGNTAVGASSLQLATANDNTAVGASSLTATTTGASNTAVGKSSLAANATGSQNTALGSGALAAYTGDNGTAVGYNSLLTVSTGAGNTAVGSSSLRSATTGGANVAVGQNSLFSATTSSNNSAIGTNALCSTLLGCENSALGACALQANTDGNFNTAVGASSLVANTLGLCSTAVGDRALSAAIAGGCNTALGASAGVGVTTGSNNLFLGCGAGAEIVTGSNNVVIGKTSALGDTTSHIYLGTNGTTRLQVNDSGALGLAGANYGTAGQVLQSNGPGSAPTWATAGGAAPATPYVSGTVFGETNNSSWRAALGYGAAACSICTAITAIGNFAALYANQNYSVTIGTNTNCDFNFPPGYGTVTAGAASNIGSGECNILIGFGISLSNACSRTVLLGTNACSLLICGTTSGWTTTSDIRQKKVVGNVPLALPFVEELSPISFYYCDRDTGEIQDTNLRYGFSAQEVSALEEKYGTPHVITDYNTEEDIYRLTPTDFIPVLVSAIKELSGKVKDIQAENTALAERVAALETLNGKG